mgnify:CR=1 FL=1
MSVELEVKNIATKILVDMISKSEITPEDIQILSGQFQDYCKQMEDVCISNQVVK